MISRLHMGLVEKRDEFARRADVARYGEMVANREALIETEKHLAHLNGVTEGLNIALAMVEEALSLVESGEERV